MISVIICSINKSLAKQVQQNIAATIGVSWECIVVDNVELPKSITSVYNAGASKAKFDTLCFVHEDVVFKTQNWGQTLVKYFENDSKLGLVGVAGSKYKSKIPSGWYTSIGAIDCCNIIHLNNTGHEQKMYNNPVKGLQVQEVVVLDGVLLVCPKKVWQEVKFDDQILHGFHLYDLDFSFRIAQKYKVIVTFEINMVHLTQGGSFGDQWLEYTLLWHKKMCKLLPAFTPEIEMEKSKFDKIIIQKWLIRLKHENIKTVNQIYWLIDIKIWLHIMAWPYVFFFLVKKYLKLQAGK